MHTAKRELQGIIEFGKMETNAETHTWSGCGAYRLWDECSAMKWAAVSHPLFPRGRDDGRRGGDMIDCLETVGDHKETVISGQERVSCTDDSVHTDSTLKLKADKIPVWTEEVGKKSLPSLGCSWQLTVSLRMWALGG